MAEEPLVDPADSDPPRTAWARLTDREREVVALVAHAHSNAPITRRLFIEPRTLKGHLTTVYRKLGLGDREGDVNRRVALARWFVLHIEEGTDGEEKETAPPAHGVAGRASRR